jgi:hypothetical protein
VDDSEGFGPRCYPCGTRRVIWTPVRPFVVSGREAFEAQDWKDYTRGMAF